MPGGCGDYRGLADTPSPELEKNRATYFGLDRFGAEVQELGLGCINEANPLNNSTYN